MKNGGGGGAHSPLWVLFELLVLYTAYFYAPRAAAIYLVIGTAALSFSL